MLGPRANEVRGQFNWMRQDLLAVVGGNYFHRVETIFMINDSPVVGFERDEQQNLLLNFRIPTMSNSPRAQIFQNWWTVPPAVEELICPPGGRLLEVNYGNGDKFRAEFFNMGSAEEMVGRYPRFASWASDVPFPITVVEVWETAAGTSLEFTPEYIRWEGGGIVNSLFTNLRAAIRADVPANQSAYLLSDRLPHP